MIDQSWSSRRVFADRVARAAIVAETRGKSLNAWVCEAIEKSIAAA
jgi:predicted HicB family RNase H-like nuclease